MKKLTDWAVLVIDMEHAFVEPESPHCIKMAKDSIPHIKQVLDKSRELEFPIFYIKRIYRSDGSDVELTRWQQWTEGGRSMAPGSTGATGADYCEEIKPKEGDYLIYKPRWSSFFGTSLDLILRRLGIKGVILTGTTTPNCIRTTAYDANSLDYEVIVISDGTSSQTPEIQAANLYDMKNMGARIMTSAEFAVQGETLALEGWVDRIREDMIRFPKAPEPISNLGESSKGWIDKW